MSTTSATHRRFKLIAGVHQHTDPVTKERIQLVAGDPNRDTVISNRNLAVLLKNKFLDLGPATAEEAAAPASVLRTTEPDDSSSIPEGREATDEFIGTADKGLKVFERAGAIKRGGGYFVFTHNVTDGFAALNEDGVGLPTGKAQDLIGDYTPPK